MTKNIVRGNGRRTARVAALLVGIGSLLGADSVAAAEVAWQTDLDRAWTAARTQRRAVLLDFTADWCVPCKAMDRDFWSRQDVAELSQRLSCVRVNYDREKLLVRQHGVGAIPAVIVLDPWRNMIARIIGGDMRQLELLLRQIPEDFSVIEPWMTTLDKDGKDFAALRGLGDFYFRHRFVSASAGFYQRALKSPTAKRDPKLRGDVLVALGWSHVNDNETKRAREDFARALEVPDLERADVALFGMVVTNLALGRRGDAEKAFAELSIRFPDSQATTAARARLQPSGKTGQR